MNSKNNNVKILVCCHKTCARIKNEVFLPVFLGSYYAEEGLKKEFKDDFWDSTGDNIGKLHPYMAEITAIYWAWKNFDKLENPEYIGLFHYRRLFNFGKKIEESDPWKTAFFNFNDETINRFGWKKEIILSQCENADLILPEKEKILDPYDWKTPCTLETHYKHSHIAEDFDIALKYIVEVTPEYKDAVEITRNSFSGYFCNMFIMKKELFFEYAEWLFKIFDGLERIIDVTDPKYKTVEQKRVYGFLAERLFNIWITKKVLDGIKIKEFQRLIGYTDNQSQKVFSSTYGNEFFNLAMLRSKNKKTYNNALLNKNDDNVIFLPTKLNYKPKVSVVIPVYNVEPYLAECIESLINQTLPEMEFIFVNDACTDNSPSILMDYYNKDPRIAIATHKKNEGLPGARNTGLQYVLGEYCALIDSDDVCDITMFEKMYSKAKLLSADIVTCCVSKFYDDINVQFEHRPLEWFNNDDVVLPLSKRSNQIQEPAAWCKLFLTSYLRSLDYFEFRPHVKKFEDVPCITSAFIQTDKIATVKENLYFYRQRTSGNLSSTMKKKDTADFVSGCLAVDDILTSHGYTDIEVLRRIEEFKLTCCDWILSSTVKEDVNYACKNLGKVLESRNEKYLDTWFQTHPASYYFYKAIQSCNVKSIKNTTFSKQIWAYTVEAHCKEVKHITLRSFIVKVIKFFIFKPARFVVNLLERVFHLKKRIRDKFSKLMDEKNKYIIDEIRNESNKVFSEVLAAEKKHDAFTNVISLGINNLDNRIDNLVNLINNLDNRFDSIDNRINELENQYKEGTVQNSINIADIKDCISNTQKKLVEDISLLNSEFISVQNNMNSFKTALETISSSNLNQLNKQMVFEDSVSENIKYLKNLLSCHIIDSENFSSNDQYPPKYKDVDGKILQCLKELDEFYFLPNSGNAGDAVIGMSSYQLFEHEKMKYHVIDKSQPMENLFEEDFNLVYGGGGVFVEQHQEGYKEFLKLFASPKIKKGIILPHTIYGAEDLLELLDQRWVVFCREEMSYNWCVAHNSKAKFYLADDMALSLDLSFLRRSNSSKTNLNNFFFSSNDWNIDVNKKIFNHYKFFENRLVNIINSAISDIGVFLRIDTEKKFDLGENLISLCDLSLYSGGGYFSDKSYTALISRLFIKTIDCFNTIVTDRLHIAICAALLGKHVYCLDNIYGKNSAVYNYSLKNLSNVKFYSNSDELLKDLKLVNGGKPKELEKIDFFVEYGMISNSIEKSENVVW